MIIQEDLDTLKKQYEPLAPNKVLDLIQAYEQTQQWGKTWRIAAKKYWNTSRAWKEAAKQNFQAFCKLNAEYTSLKRDWTELWAAIEHFVGEPEHGTNGSKDTVKSAE
jgi:hypothetical protein